MSAARRQFEAHDPDFERRVRDSFARQQVMALVGAQLEEVAAGYARITLPYRPELSQQHGYFHGGIIGTIGDSAAGYAGYTLMPAHTEVLTVEYKLNLMAPAAGDRLVAHGRVIRPGRTLVVTEADLYVTSGGQTVQCAVLLQTLMCPQQRPDPPVQTG